MRKHDVECLLYDVREQIRQFDLIALSKTDNKTIEYRLKPKVKTALEHLRSCLDYFAHDIYETIMSGPSSEEHIYFPYGKSEEEFSKRINKSPLAKLKATRSDLYDLVESIQPHMCKATWLVDLCSYVNQNKHNQLSDNDKIDGLQIGNAIFVDDKSTVIFSDCVINNNQVNHLEIKSGKFSSNDDVEIEINKYSRFMFSGTNIDIYDLLNSALIRIELFKDDLYALIIR